jgi:predicted lipid-binding transport protein (Tim44 family)
MERTLAKAKCIQGCAHRMDSAELQKCFSDCENVKPARPVEVPRENSPPAYVAPEKPFISHFWIVGIVLGLVAVGGAVRHFQKKRDQKFWDSVHEDLDRSLAFKLEQEAAKKRHANVTRALAAVKSADDGFSQVLFEDFLHTLYVETQKKRGGNQLELLTPFLGTDARAAYAAYPVTAVTSIVVGSMETREVTADDDGIVHVTVAFDVNYTEERDGAHQSYYVHEIWKLARKREGKSREPKHARVIGCGNCGAPLDQILGETCQHCSAPAGSGRRDWVVTAIGIEARELRGPMLTGTTEEEGTDLTTVVSPDAKPAFRDLGQRDPGFSWAEFVKRVELVFHTFHRTWSAQDLREVRPFLSDNLFETQSYWVATYKTQNLRNVTERPTVVSVQLSRIVHDKYYDAITVRVFAECVDYTVDQSGKLVGGSKERVRQYSEYWTFIRLAGVTGAPRVEPKCPSCGAPNEHIADDGVCRSCHVKVTTGDFDWTLSRIEQDEVYRL